jgi:hypothetical protein
VVSPTLLPHSLHLPRNTLLGLHTNQLSVVFLEHLPNIPILGAHIHNTCHRKKYISSFKTPYMLRECEAQVPSTEDCAAVIFCCVSYKRNNTWNLAVPKNLQDIACQKSNERKCHRAVHEGRNLTVLTQLSEDSAITSTVMTTSLKSAWKFH